MPSGEKRGGVGLCVIRDFGQGASLGRDRPDIGVARIFIRLAGTVAYEGEGGAIGRPLRVSVVPFLAIGELLRSACFGIYDEEVRALIVEPAGIVKLVANIGVVADVAWRLAVVGGSGA